MHAAGDRLHANREGVLEPGRIRTVGADNEPGDLHSRPYVHTGIDARDLDFFRFGNGSRAGVDSDSSGGRPGGRADRGVPGEQGHSESGEEPEYEKGN